MGGLDALLDSMKRRLEAFVYRQMRENQEGWQGLSMTEETKEVFRFVKSIKMG